MLLFTLPILALFSAVLAGPLPDPEDAKSLSISAGISKRQNAVQCWQFTTGLGSTFAQYADAVDDIVNYLNTGPNNYIT
jgi:hypothetical protein